MNKKESFKEFVKSNPQLIKYVNKGEMTWQKFYDMYDIYGKDNNVWDSYLKKDIVATAGVIGVADIFNFLKNINLDKVEESINSIQRVLGVLEDLGNKKEVKTDYKARPLYKHFED